MIELGSRRLAVGQLEGCGCQCTNVVRFNLHRHTIAATSPSARVVSCLERCNLLFGQATSLVAS